MIIPCSLASGHTSTANDIVRIDLHHNPLTETEGASEAFSFFIFPRAGYPPVLERVWENPVATALEYDIYYTNLRMVPWLETMIK